MKRLKLTVALLTTLAVTQSYAETVTMGHEVDIEYLSDRFDEPVLHVMDSIINYETGNGGLVVIKDKDGGVLCINNITGNKSSEVKFHDGQVYISGDVRGRAGWKETLYVGQMSNADTNPLLELTQYKNYDMDGDEIYTGNITYIGNVTYVGTDGSEMRDNLLEGTMNSVCKINVTTQRIF
ncbi:hypothetical protein BAZMOX_213116_0 [methanotrophic endosymbiont of Bathymodiolus azoricus (Menez Gwen)]|jgi:hypothetical protein|nr:hypothetical protein BAZMOX_213116_0 [methanotrophic endosymbiont of Bathymodiolus azoricus (Menez Gwen)]